MSVDIYGEFSGYLWGFQWIFGDIFVSKGKRLLLKSILI